ncbi:MAG: alkaline phosphatase family protein [Oscillospiraceae bacterium]|nr:alkaline phosphatase family protein [Oscillospiraceae bacterium]
MEQKVLLILADGMRPDSLSLCGAPFLASYLAGSRHTLHGRTVMPSVTLPCHMSLFHSVEPARHGVLTNVYTPQTRPIDGLFEQVKRCGGTTAMFYDWEPLRDISRPGSLDFSLLAAASDAESARRTMQVTTEAACRVLPDAQPDFAFLYFGLPDETGHQYGWMGGRYLDSVRNVLECVLQVTECLPPCYRTILLADHGGHGRNHGDDTPEDMTIPIVCRGPEFRPGKLEGVPTILDVAPTVAALLGIPANNAWEGRSLLAY